MSGYWISDYYTCLFQLSPVVGSWNQEGRLYFNAPTFVQLYHQRGFSGGGSFGSSITQDRIYIANSPGASPLAGSTYVITTNSGTYNHTIDTSLEGIYDARREINTEAGTQPAAWSNTQFILYSF